MSNDLSASDDTLGAQETETRDALRSPDHSITQIADHVAVIIAHIIARTDDSS